MAPHRLFLFFIMGLALCSCAQHEIELHPEAFNRAIGSLDTRLLLLNSARASKNYPTQFTSVSTVLGSSKTNSELDPTLPLPFDPSRSYDPGLKIAHERGFSQLSVSNLNTKEAQKGLKKPITLLDVRSYVLSGWPAAVLETLAFEEIKVHAALQKEMDRITAQKCGPGTGERATDYYDACDAIRYWKGVCDSRRPPPSKIANVRMHRYFNWPKSKCDYAKFQTALSQLGVLGLTLLPLTKVVTEEVIDTGRILRKKSVKTVVRFAFDHPRLNEIMLRHNEAHKRFELGGLQITLRSAERMVRFLGELIALQNYGREKFVPRVIIDGRPVDLFVVTTGQQATVDAAVAVQDSEGEFFSVPIPVYDSKERHRTLQVMALVIDVLNASVSKAAIPQVQTVTLSGP